MKKEIFALLLLLLIVAGCLLNLRHLKQFSENLLAEADAAWEAACIGDWERARSGAEALLEQWKNADGYTHIFIRHSEIGMTTEGICSFLGHLRAESPGDAYGAWQALRAQLESLYGMERLSFGSIF